MSATADDDFDAILAGLDFDEPEPDTAAPAVVDVSTLNPAELNRAHNACKQELLDRGELLNPTTDRGRELHSLRAACAIALRRLGLIG